MTLDQLIPLMRKDCLALQARMAAERAIVKHLIDTALAAGWTVPYVYDGGERVKCSTAAQAMDAVFAVDDSTIYFKKAPNTKAHCAVIILGNGVDCISDHSVGEDFESEVMVVSTAFIDALEVSIG